MHTPVTLGGVTAPDTAHTRKAADLVARVHNREMLNKEPEIALVHMGSHLDVLGFHYDELTPQLIDDTLQLYPRVGFAAAFQAALAEVVRKKPILAAGTGLVDIGHRHVPGFSLPNGCDLLDNTVFDTRHTHSVPAPGHI